MTTDYAIVFDKLKEVIETETETETANVRLLVPNADDVGFEEIQEIDEIRRLVGSTRRTRDINIFKHIA